MDSLCNQPNWLVVFCFLEGIDMKPDYTQFETQRRVLLEYLQVMIALEDWHGVSDAANDLRVLEAKNGYFDREHKKNGS
jgi:hypothetical protein